MTQIKKMFCDSFGCSHVVCFHVREAVAEKGSVAEYHGRGLKLSEFLIYRHFRVSPIDRTDKKSVNLSCQKSSDAGFLTFWIVQGLRNDDFIAHFVSLLLYGHKGTSIHWVAQS